ncbi:hypothetical protein CMUS01_09141 [Colletotrichum musicola]|uniref:C2H2-type domain-containing protein n=1 Tax=Colletotrichum musicola TaxID=2175873 RepID=A0A8H6K9U9_9PEZI|nr:hypothetical protein CMUS01_09141 [Colletotrichum musicola]
MAPRRLRRDAASDEVQTKRQEEAKRRLQEKLDAQASGAVTRNRALAPKSRKSRDALWEASVSYFRDVACRDHKQVWLGLCLDEPEAETICKDFLEYYLLSSEDRRLVFGPQESEEKLSITCVNTIESAWKSLVAEADDRILYNMRLEDPRNKRRWMLCLPNQEKDTMGMFPSSRIRRWILDDLAPRYGLSFEQTFVKREATAEVLLQLLVGLWEQAPLIPCAPETRFSFDWALTLLGVSGFRVCEVMDIPYRRVELGMVRDPSDATKAVPVATIHLEHQKQETNAVTTVPCRVVCLTRKIIARALSDDAFEAGFASYDELLRRPILENVGYVPLKWKAEFADRVWRQVQTALGMREHIRVHSIRPAFRNYILGNTSAVYEKSYIPQQISGKDLMKAAWAALAGTDEITPQLRHATFTRDENAPMYPTAEDYDNIESRKDITALRREVEAMRAEHGAGSEEARKAKLRLDADITALRKLGVAERRKKYFAEADRLRSLGVPTVSLRASAGSKRTASRYSRSVPDAVRIGRLMQESERQDEEFETEYFESFTAFLHNIHSRRASVSADDLDDGPKNDKPECLLCGLPCAHRSSLTRHVGRAHEKTFAKPFHCPECSRQRLKPMLITGKSHWSNHVAKQHGRANAPNVPSRVKGPIWCLICNLYVSGPANLRKHVRDLHVPLGLFDKPFDCPECLRLGEGQAVINGLQGWRDHVGLHHCADEAPPEQRPTVACLMCDKTCAIGAAMTKHFVTQHVHKERIFRSDFEC